MQAFSTLFALSALFISIDSTRIPEASISNFSISNATGLELASSKGNTDFVPCKGVYSPTVLQSLSLSPDPPIATSPITVSSRGKVSVAITKGAKMTISTKLGLITVDSQTFDMCAEAKNIGKKCPVAPGTHDFKFVLKSRLTLESYTPSDVPYKPFDVRAEAVNGDGKPLLCFTYQYWFSS